jgi:hypothetical protein
MLEYQHYIWHEIAGRVDHLLARYGAGEMEDGASAGDDRPGVSDRSDGDGHAGGSSHVGMDVRDGREQS